MAPKRSVKINNYDFNKLTANDVICPICRGILIRPITLPCSHGFCFLCFETTIAGTTTNECPLCGVRIGSWLRSATKSNKLINETYWKAIQERFPSQVQNKLDRTDGNSIECKYGTKRNCDNDVIVTSQPKAKFNNNVVKSLEGNGCQLNIINKTKSIVDNNQGTYKPEIIRNCSHKPAATSVVNNYTVPNSSTITSIKNNQNKANANQQTSNPMIISSKEYIGKEYSCRILCQNVSSTIEKQHHPLLVQNVGPESQKKSKLKPAAAPETDSKGMSERSNSIESECLYFKPIDHRHNPPSEGSAPIKVPSRRPTPNANVKVIPPSGRNTLTISPLECAFAKLFIPSTENESKDATMEDPDCHKEVIEKEPQSRKKPRPIIPTERKDPLNSLSSTIKRRSRKTENNVIAKIKQLKQRYPVVELEVMNISEMASPPFQGFKNNNDIVNKKTNSTRSSTKTSSKNSRKKSTSNKLLQNEDAAKRIAQEKADYELAKKLQEQFNQLTTYVTRSSVSKCNSTKR